MEPQRFAAIGLDHLHVVSQINALSQAGAKLVAFHPGDAPLAALVTRMQPDAEGCSDPRRILEDPSIDVVVTAAIPSQRAGVALEAMRHGKDVLVDKPGAVTLEQLEELRNVQQETRRFWAVFFSERLESPATLRALDLVRQGAIGSVIQTLGLGPHRLGAVGRPEWFFDPARGGGILTDLASHQVDQFLVLTDAEDVHVESALVANRATPEHPDFRDFGELLLRGDRATGYARVDWFTPDGLPTWGDVRLTVLGTEGTIELRKNVDLAGREGGEHLFLVDRDGVSHIDCALGPKPFAGDWLRDVAERRERALPSAHCFRVSELALRAQALADSRSAPAG